MKPTVSQANKRRAFTIIELLTVMSIIVILIGLLVPALNKARRYATYVRQMAQFHSMDAAIELFNNEFGGYPPSTAQDDTSTNYCGAMKLCEALMGQDLLGFHSNSLFRRIDTDPNSATCLYPRPPSSANLKARKGPYLQAENANAYRMDRIYGTNVAPFLRSTFVLCDVYERPMAKSGQKTGMPILYYKADTANNFHDPNGHPPAVGDSNGNIYNYWDNQALLALGKPWEAGGTPTAHALATPSRFYKNTQSHKITTAVQPYRSDTYVLLSAGWDGEYGTADDIFNFEWKAR